MQLTARNLGELVKSLRSSPRGTSEKRAEPRVGVRIKVELLPIDPKTGVGLERVGAWVRDVSAGGVGLLCDRHFKVGDSFDLVAQGDDNAEERIGCVIQYCGAVGTDLFRLGAKFRDYRPKDDDDD